MIEFIKKLKDSYINLCKKYKELSTITIMVISFIITLTIILICVSATKVTTEKNTEVLSKNVVSYDNKGEEYFFNDDYEAAIEEYSKLNEKEEWPIYEIKMAEVCTAQGNYDRSDGLVDSAYEKRNQLIINENNEKYLDKDGELGNYICLLTMLNGKYEKAQEYGEIFLQDNPDNKELQRSLFTIYLVNNNLDKAKALLENYKVDEKSSYDIALYADMNMLLGNSEKVFEYLSKAWNVNKDEVKVFDLIYQLASRNREGTINTLEKLCNDNPKEISYKVMLLKCYSMSKNTIKEANDLYKEIEKEDLGEYAFDTVLAKIYQNNGKKLEAEELINKLISKENYIGYHTAGWYYSNEGDYEKALELCKKSIAENPDYIDNYGLLMTEILIKSGEAKKAEPYYTIALLKEPFNISLLINASNYYNGVLEDANRAYGYMKLASLIKPNDDRIYYNLSMIAVDNNKRKEAIELINKSISLNKDEYSYHRALGTLYLNEGEDKKAIEEIREAYKLNNDDILTLNNAGCYYITVEKDIRRGYENIKGAYDKLSDDVDKNTRGIITDNYEKAKKLLEKYNSDNSKLEVPELHLFY